MLFLRFSCSHINTWLLFPAQKASVMIIFIHQAFRCTKRSEFIMDCRILVIFGAMCVMMAVFCDANTVLSMFRGKGATMQHPWCELLIA